MRNSRTILFFTVFLIAFACAFPLPPSVLADSDPGVYIARPTAHAISGLTVTDPAYAYNIANATGAAVALGVVGNFDVKTFTKGTFTSNDVIGIVDICMNYEHPGGGKGSYRIKVRVDPSTDDVILQDWTTIAYGPATRIWADIKDPNDLVWTWDDISKIHVIVECGQIGGGGTKTLDEYEVWANVYYYNVPSLYVDPTSTIQGVGNSFSIDINITGFGAGSWSGGVYGWEFDLNYDNTTLHATSATEGTYLSSIGTTSFYLLNLSDTLGRIRATCTLQGDVRGKTGDGILATIGFSVIASGSCNLDLAGTKLAGYDFWNKRIYSISHNAVDGTFASGAVPEFPYGAALEIAAISAIFYVFWKQKRKKVIPPKI